MHRVKTWVEGIKSSKGIELWKRNNTVVVALLVMTLISVIPVFVPGVVFGHDVQFHINRIEGMAQGILNGDFLLRIHPDALNSYGYPFSIYYGNLLLYIPAFLRVLGFSVSFAYEAYIVIISFWTSLVSYVCLKKIFGRDEIALLGALVYVTSSYRMVDVFVRAALGEYTAFMYMPIIVLAIYRIYTEDVSDGRRYMKNAIWLALGMTGLIQCHVLSTEMVAIFIAIVCILFFKKTIRWRTILAYLAAVAITVLMNLFFLVPLIDYYLNVDVAINAIEELYIRHKGAYLGQYFMFFENVFGTINGGIRNRMSLTPGAVLMATALIWCFYVMKGKKDVFANVMGVLSAIALWMASNLFPWNSVVRIPLIGELFIQVQFPFRYLSIGCICLVILMCRLCKIYEQGFSENNRKMIYGAIAVVSVVMACYVSSNIGENENDYSQGITFSPRETADVDSCWVGNYDYVRNGTRLDCLDGQVYTQDLTVLEHVQKDRLKLSFYCETEAVTGYAAVPLFHYKGYKAYSEDGAELLISDGDNNVIRVEIPAHYKGMVYVQFEEPWYWQLANVISLITGLGLIMIAMKNPRR